MKKHPVLTTILLLLCLIIGFGLIIKALMGPMSSSSGIAFTNKIGVIPVIGAIEDSTELLKQITTFAKDKSIKAIIMRIDSPGGGVGASQEIYREIMRTRDKKKVVVSMGGTAASGGYYIASAGSSIVANPGTITGSIGVIMQYYQYRELAEKIGFKTEVIKSGEFKDTGNPHREITEGEKKILETVISDIQTQFINDVAKGRNLDPEKIREIADGRIITGAMAKEWGLVDQLGNFEDAVAAAKEYAGIEGEVNLVFPEKKRISVFDLLRGEAAQSIYRMLRDISGTRIEYRWDGFSSGIN